MVNLPKPPELPSTNIPLVVLEYIDELFSVTSPCKSKAPKAPSFSYNCTFSINTVELPET